MVAEFTAEPKASAELDRLLVLADEVMRHKIIRVPEKVAGRAAQASASRRAAARRRAGRRKKDMANGNNITLVGNITRDPELRFTPTGQATATFGVAVNRRWQNRQTQEWEEATSFFDVVCWREMAENASESLARGSRVIVTGRLEQR